MRKICLIGPMLGLLVCLNVQAADNCEKLIGCDAKICHIEKQLEFANENNYINKANGLRTALDNVKDHCTLDGLSADLQDEINDVKDDLSEHRKDLSEAMQDQELDKIEKYQSKIKEDQLKLQSLQNELQKLK